MCVCLFVCVCLCMCIVVVKEHLVQEQEQLLQERLHLEARFVAVQTECQREREVREEYVELR